MKKYKMKKAASGLQDIAVPEQGSFSNVASSTASLAGAGAQVGGPWGAAIGGALGLGVGLLQKGQQDRDNKNALATNRDRSISRMYSADDPSVNQANQRFSKGGKVKTKTIEIEGKKTPEIHTDKNFNVKNLGTTPHSKGGDKVEAEEGDIVFNTQNSLSKYNKIASAINNKDTKTLHAEKNKLPEDKGSKNQSGNRGIKKGPRYTVNSYGDKTYEDISKGYKVDTPQNTGYNKRPKGNPMRSLTAPVNNFFTPKPFNIDTRLNPATAVNNKVATPPVSTYTPGQNYVKTPDFTLGANGKGINNTIPINPIINKAITPVKSRPVARQSTPIAKTPVSNMSTINALKPTATKFSTIGDGSDLANPKTKDLLDLNTNQGTTPASVETVGEGVTNKSKLAGNNITNSTVNNILPFAGVANNLFQGLKKEPTLNESYYNPDKIAYTDRSSGLRKQSSQAMNVENANARALSGGNVANLRANMNNAAASNLDRQGSIDEREQARADAVTNANTEIGNQAKNINLQRKDNYQNTMMANRAAKEAFIGQAASDIGQYGLAKQEEGYLRSRDDKANAAQMAGYNSINGRYQHKSNLDGSTYFDADADSSITKFGTSGGNRKVRSTKAKSIFKKGTKSINIKSVV